MILLLKLKVTE